MTFFAAFYISYMATLYAILIGFAVVSYVLTGKSLSAIARRRGIEKPWLAWVPVGCDWLLGCISDQYRYVVHNQERDARSKLLRLSIAMVAMAVGVLLLAGVAIIMGVMEAAAEGVLVLTMLMLLLTFAMLGVAVVYTIAYYKAYFDLFRSCDPKKSVVFLLVGIFVGYPLPFFVFACRNKDLGMPPRIE